MTSLSATSTSPPLPQRVVLRVLSLLPRNATLRHALRASPEWTETMAVGLALEFVQRLRSQTRTDGGHAYVESSDIRGRETINVLMGFYGQVEPPSKRRRDELNAFQAFLVEFFMANRVVPQQLVQDGGLPLRRLIVEAAASRPVIWIVRSSSADEWVETVLRGVLDASQVTATPCCTAMAVRDNSGAQGVTLRFLPTKYRQGTFFNAAAAAGHLDCMHVIRRAVPGASADLIPGLCGSTASHSATTQNRPDCLRLLLQWGVDPHVHESGENIAHRAVRSNSVACLRIAHEFGVNLSEAKTLSGTTPGLLAAAGHPECLRALHELGVRLDTPSAPFATTPAHEAARTNSVECLRMLIEWGAYSSIETTSGLTPVHMAASTGSNECLQLLLDAKLGHPNQANSGGQTLVHFAAKGGHEPTLTWLVSCGGDITAVDANGWTAGHHAAHAGSMRCLRALLDQGLDVHALDKEGNSMVHCAARNGTAACLELLLSRSAALATLTNHKGDAPAHVASGAKCVQCLHQYGADLNQPDAEGRTPSDRATAENRRADVWALADLGGRLSAE